MSDIKDNAAATGKKASKYLFQGRIFSLDFFRRNWIYIIFVVVMALAYIGNKFSCQSSIQELLSLQDDLSNAQTDLVKSSADYNSMIRESEMVKLMNSKRLGLTAPKEPPYHLSEQ
jgi:hypothetical protein